MSQNEQKMAKIMHNAAKKFDWEGLIYISSYKKSHVSIESLVCNITYFPKNFDSS